ncbi:MAG TPA: hypothetical protein VK158_05320 [Acidobacteriota bacterium]|nr:hypothetical protein [Acidobacteriota bacterium]
MQGISPLELTLLEKALTFSESGNTKVQLAQDFAFAQYFSQNKNDILKCRAWILYGESSFPRVEEKTLGYEPLSIRPSQDRAPIGNFVVDGNIFVNMGFKAGEGEYLRSHYTAFLHVKPQGLLVFLAKERLRILSKQELREIEADVDAIFDGLSNEEYQPPIISRYMREGKLPRDYCSRKKI